MNQIQQKKKNLQQPGIEPGPDPWQGPILPLDYYCSEEKNQLRSFHNWICHGFVKEETNKKII